MSTSRPLTVIESLNRRYGPIIEGTEEADPFRLRRAIDEFIAALPGCPREYQSNVLNSLGVLFGKADRHQEAAETFERALALGGEREASLINLAKAHSELGQDDLAYLRAKEGIALSPIRAFVLQANILLAVSSERLGEHRRAMATMRALAELCDSQNANEMFNLAGVAARLGADEDAVEYFAQHLAAHFKIEIGSASAVNFIETVLSRGGYELDDEPIAASLRKVTAQYRSPGRVRGLSAHMDLTAEEEKRVVDLIENPPAPTEALRRILHD